MKSKSSKSTFKPTRVLSGGYGDSDGNIGDDSLYEEVQRAKWEFPALGTVPTDPIILNLLKRVKEGFAPKKEV